MPHFAPYLTQAPRDLAAWAALFEHSQLPVLDETLASLQELAENEDAVDARLVADAVVNDPLMTIKLVAHVAHLRRGREGGDAETVTEAMVMLGVPPFFRAFADQPSAEQRLRDHPEALEGFRRVLQRSRRAACFAMGFAVHRMDTDAAVIHEAALLHDFAELLLWLCAPALAQAIEARKQADPTLRTAVVQQELLHIGLDELEHRLMVKWRLPGLLVQITDQQATTVTAQMRNVRLAMRVARHSAVGWDNPALPEDIADVATLLNIAPDSALRLLREIDAD